MNDAPILFDPRLLMVQGTTSDAGKSTLITALCRLLARGGHEVAPFKSQNMALNSAVTVEGGEIGRAQAVQALACGRAPSHRFNPILLKPTGQQCSQVIIDGQSIGHFSARDYHDLKPHLHAHVVAHLRALAEEMAFVMIEGAGSPAEINLRQNDLANMGLALAAGAPVILVADIDRGGVFAHLVGTLALLTEQERRHVVGMVINRFRGDISLLEPGIDWLESRTGLPVLAVVPWIEDLHLDAEDSLCAPHCAAVAADRPACRVTVVNLPGLSNRTDIDALALHPDVALTLARAPADTGPADLVILPGSKCTLNDLAWLRSQGWERWISRHLRYGGKVLGICGGYQMLGRWLEDPDGHDSPGDATRPARVPGLGWLGHTTRFGARKTLRHSHCVGGFRRRTIALSGYEIHVGVSSSPDAALGERAFARHQEAPWDVEGARSADDQVIGTYLHGLLDRPEALDDLLQWIAPAHAVKRPHQVDMNALRERDIDRLAETVGTALRLSRWPEGALKKALYSAVVRT